MRVLKMAIDTTGCWHSMLFIQIIGAWWGRRCIENLSRSNSEVDILPLNYGVWNLSHIPSFWQMIGAELE